MTLNDDTEFKRALMACAEIDLATINNSDELFSKLATLHERLAFYDEFLSSNLQLVAQLYEYHMGFTDPNDTSHAGPRSELKYSQGLSEQISSICQPNQREVGQQFIAFIADNYLGSRLGKLPVTSYSSALANLRDDIVRLRVSMLDLASSLQFVYIALVNIYSHYAIKSQNQNPLLPLLVSNRNKYINFCVGRNLAHQEIEILLQKPEHSYAHNVNIIELAIAGNNWQWSRFNNAKFWAEDQGLNRA